MKLIIQLFLSFAKVGVLTFGGGVAMLPLLQREIVQRRHWVEELELLDYYAIGQVTPGIIAVNTATFVGYKKKGFWGALAGTCGVVFPSIIIITLLAGILLLVKDNVYVQKAFAGIRISVCSLIIVSIFRLAKKALTDLRTCLVCLVCFALQLFVLKSPVLVSLCAVLYSLVLFFCPKTGEKAL